MQQSAFDPVTPALLQPNNRDNEDPNSSDKNAIFAVKEKPQQQTFLGLPLLVVRLVLDLLDLEDIYTFRFVSHACRHLSEPIIFRNLVLHDRTFASAKIFYRLSQRLSDPEDALRDIVHHLRIGPVSDRQSYPGDFIVERVIKNVEDLRDFSWHMRFPIPKQILEFLHTQRTSTRIHIVNMERNIDRRYIPPDYGALSSLQLHSLEYTAYGSFERISHLESEFYSELFAIKNCLLKARNLKSLRLVVSQQDGIRQDFWTKGPKCMTFDEGETFPPLQELSFQVSSYELSEKYCQQWAKAADWSKLHRLDLEDASPKYLFAALTGRVPHLKILIFGFCQHYTWASPNAKIFKAFSNSINGLEEIVVKNLDAIPFNEVKDDLLSKHGHSLKILRVSYGVTGKGWEAADVEGLARKCPGLQNLVLKIAAVQDNYAAWPEDTMKAFQNLKHLRNLEIILFLDAHLQLGQDSTQLRGIRTFSNGGQFRLKEEAVKEQVITLYKQLIGDVEHSLFESLNVKLQASNYYSEWVISSKAQSRDGKRLQLENNFTTTDPLTPNGSDWDTLGYLTPNRPDWDPFV